MMNSIDSEDFLYRGIPYTITQRKNEKQKPLLFFFHGFQSDRKKASMGRVEALASLGYAVVSMDAYNHGERQSQVFREASIKDKYAQILEIITHTANDALLLTEEIFRFNPHFNTSIIDVYGVSMGGMVGVAFGVISQTINRMVILVSSPKLLDYYLDRQRTYHFSLPSQTRLEFYRQFDPQYHPERLRRTKLCFCVGDQDQVVLPVYTTTFVQDHPELDIAYQIYPTAHVSTPKMLDDAISFLKQTLESV